MDNTASQKELTYTRHRSDYKGYSIHWATTPSQSEQGRYLGYFFAMKDGEDTLRGVLGRPLDNQADAQNEAVAFAKLKIDEATSATSASS